MTTHDLYMVLLVGTGVLLLAVVSVRFSRWAGLPTLLIYLGFGLVLGEAGFGIQYEDAALTRVLGFVALAIILNVFDTRDEIDVDEITSLKG